MTFIIIEWNKPEMKWKRTESELQIYYWLSLATQFKSAII